MTNTQDVIDYFGGATALAKLLDIRQGAVSQWKWKQIPPFRALQIEVLSHGKFKALDMNPDVKQYIDAVRAIDNYSREQDQ